MHPPFQIPYSKFHILFPLLLAAMLLFSLPQKAHATVIFLTSGTSWSVPSDWNNSANTIEVIGGGAAGGATFPASGGGGGAYSAITNLSLTPEGSVSYAVGVAGTNEGAGGDTYFCNSTSNCASIAGSAVVVGAKGGGASSGLTPGTGGQASSGVGTTKYSGGNGGTDAGGGAASGGGGAAGPHGDGKNGGSNTNSGQGGGGGGGANNGSVGNNGSGHIGGAGGNGRGGSGGGASGGGTGTDGGGGGGATNASGNAGPGGQDTIWTQTSNSATAGPGGGGGGADGDGGAGGGYGGAGGGARTATSPVGTQGIIVITYTPVSAPDAPTNLTTSSASTGVSLSWTAPSGSPTTYGIWRGSSSFSATTSATLIASISSAATNYTDTSATRGTTYFYRVTATDGNGTSTLSNQKASGAGSGRIVRLKGMRLR